MRTVVISIGASVIAATAIACSSRQPMAPSGHNMSSHGGGMTMAQGGGGFDEYGYNYAARLFNGTGESWCLEKSLPANCMGDYSPDKLVMKWNAEWDRGNDEGWDDPNGYDAWEDNEWNGTCPNCSGAVWHYKIKWVGDCGADYTLLDDGGYCIWGQFDVVMDQGIDPSYGPGHLWFAQARPNGVGNF